MAGEKGRGGRTGSLSSVLEQIDLMNDDVQRSYDLQRRILSFDEFLEIFEENPQRYCRNAASYVFDMVESYGSDSKAGPFGKTRRYRLFDQPFRQSTSTNAESLVGQEAVQEALVRALSHFKREGKANRVVLLHGPNGSSKSTIAACLMAGLEDYSAKDEGALYRFHWVFPKKSSTFGAIGFTGQNREASDNSASYAHLKDEELATRLLIEVRDHPLLLLPHEVRERLLAECVPQGVSWGRWLVDASLCHKNQQIFSALLSSYQGSLKEVLRHVQIERYFLSRRYRLGAVTLGPELSVDAQERQVTVDSNLGALPTSLQGLSLYDVSGELLDASGGILELSDLLKRPIDAFKYLQTSAETGEVALGSQVLTLNHIFLASGNELHLSAFREHPEFESFRGRFDLIPVPYLRNHFSEQEIYDAQVKSRLSGEVAPHATAVAARFATLTRLMKPDEEKYPEELRPVVKQMTAWLKLGAYAGEITELDVDGHHRPLVHVTELMGKERESLSEYEGIGGVSPRVMRTLLLDAAQDSAFQYLSPFSVLDELDRLCKKTKDYVFLRYEAIDGGYHDHALFRAQVRTWLLDTIEHELRVASGLVDEAGYEELLHRYITHVSAWVKGEKIEDSHTGVLSPPDEGLMLQVEELLELTESKKEARAGVLGRIAAWAIDHPGEKLVVGNVFRERLGTMQKAVFNERRVSLGHFGREFTEALEGDAPIVEPKVSESLQVLCERFGYTRQSARDAVARLLAERLNDGAEGQT